MTREIEDGFGASGYGPLSSMERDLERAFDDLHQAKGRISELEAELADLKRQVAGPKCKNCKYWQSKEEYSELEGFHSCSSEKFLGTYNASEPDEAEKFTPDMVILECDEGWGINTGPEFGCVHFVAIPEPKEK